MNVELWIDASRLQALLSQLEAQEDCFTEVANIKELTLLKQGVAAFIADHASCGAIPSDPLGALQEELSWAEETTGASQRLLKEASWPLDHAFLFDQHWWGTHAGFRQTAHVAIPDADFWARAKLEDTLAPQPYIKDLTAVAAGGHHCLALGRDGTVFGWGAKGAGQTNPDLTEKADTKDLEQKQAEELEFLQEKIKEDINTPPIDELTGSAEAGVELEHQRRLMQEKALKASERQPAPSWAIDPALLHIRAKKLTDNDINRTMKAKGFEDSFPDGRYDGSADLMKGGFESWPEIYGLLFQNFSRALGQPTTIGLEVSELEERAAAINAELFGESLEGEKLAQIQEEAKNIFWKKTMGLAGSKATPDGFAPRRTEGIEPTPNGVAAYDDIIERILLETWEDKEARIAKEKSGDIATQDELTPRPPSINAHSIAAGNWHGLALKRDCTLIGWGNNDHGQATPPDNLQGVTAIAAGGNHSLALLENGTVVGWGNNYHGQITPPENLQGVAWISAGQDHSMALLENGAVVGWGQQSSRAGYATGQPAGSYGNRRGRGPQPGPPE